MAANTSLAGVAATLGKYRLIAELGTGGMAVVYLAVMQGRSGFNKLFVLKIPRNEVANDPNALPMFLDEARIAARLSHPNIIQTFEVIHESERDILVMEYLDGYSLNDAIVRTRNSGGKVPMLLQLRIVSEALKGLHYAHEAKDFDGSPLEFVHRDVSPHNVFLTFDGQVKLLDFGIAKAAMQSHQTEFGTLKGKVRYMPVEQLSGAGVDRRADIFAVGIMLWEAAVGERLWHNRNDIEVMTAVIGGNVPMPRDMNPDVSPELDAICRRALAHKRDDRYATALELQTDIDAFLAAQPASPTLHDVTSFLEATLSSRRAARRTIIEEQLKLLSTVDVDEVRVASIPPPSVGELPVLPSLGITDASASGSGRSSTGGIGLSRTNEPPPPATTTSRRWPVLLAFGLLLAITVTLAVTVLRREPVRTVAAAVPTDSSGPVDLPPMEKVAPPTSVAVALAPSASASPSPTAALPPTGQPAVTVPAISTVAATHPVAMMTARPLAPHPAASQPAVTAAAPEPPGTFSFTTYPWAKVYENGKLLGTTPLYKVPLSPGTHVLSLENPDQGIKTSYSVTIKSGEPVTRTTALK